MKSFFTLISFLIFSFSYAEQYTFSPKEDKLKVIIDQKTYTLDFFHSFTYWKDFGGTYNYDGYTDLSGPVSMGSGVEVVSLNQKRYFFYVYLPKEIDRSGKELQSLPEQYINYLSSLKEITFYHLPHDRQSSQYPPDYWAYNNYKNAYPLPSMGKCQHADLGEGSWYLYFWNHADGGKSLLLAISYEKGEEHKWFTSAMQMIKKK